MTPQRARVELRSPTPEDRDEFLAAMQTSRKLHHPWLQSPLTDDAYDQLLARVGDERFDPLFVCLQDGGAIVGYMNISQIVRGPFQSAFLGYGAVAAYVGRGYMSEGLQLVLGRAFTDLRLHRLEANIQPGNTSSIALVKRAGFVHEGFAERYLKINGRWRDHEHWAIRAEQWRDHRRRRTR
ncbi:MAG TPA: GNAT family protein [Solirubrobacteraceae bacterium]|nr:GNAT family protein [Solirubrobacteraceae bacterium]